MSFKPTGLKYAIVNKPGFESKSLRQTHLKHVANVLERMGYQKVKYEDDWDVLWTLQYPFMDKYLVELVNLNRTINHFPGTGSLVSKMDLSTSGIKYIPKSFHFPNQTNEFLVYQKQNLNALFVEKSLAHRNIFLKPVSEIDFNANNSFVQEFIENPYLIDGYKFDIGVYVVLTNLNPLRVYIYTGDYAFRFCAEKYYPFDASNVNKYVVRDNYIPMWNIPSLKTYFNTFKFNFKDSFDAFVQKQNQNSQVIWDQIEEIIRFTILAQETELLIDNSKNNRGKFFELMRFDFIVDKSFKVYLMEANFSPNLSSSAHEENAVYFEQIIYNVMQLVGIGSSIKRETLEIQAKTVELMVSSDKNIATAANECINYCNENCNHVICNLCLNCMNKNDLEILHATYREHIRRADTKRIFPKPIINLNEYDIREELKGLNPSNQMITKWFYEKCKIDSTWCT